MSLQNLINNHPVLVLSKKTCKYCVIAKDALKNAGMDFFEVNIDEHFGLLTEAIDLTGQKTVPNIWINQVHIGGSDKLIEWLKKNKPLVLDNDF
jgi:glutaredoxin